MPNPPIITNSRERIDSILDNTAAIFTISANPNADPHYGEWRAVHTLGALYTGQYENIINAEAAAQGVNANLVKAIMYVEVAQGGLYGIPAQSYSSMLVKSLYPMNIRPNIWQDLVPGGDFTDPAINIKAGVTLIKRISDRLENPTVEKIATLYNSTGQEIVLGYGARVKTIYDNQLWTFPSEYPPGYDAVSAVEYFGITNPITNLWDSIHDFDVMLEDTGKSFLESIALNIALSDGFANALKGLFGEGTITDPQINSPISHTDNFSSIVSISNSIGQTYGDALSLGYLDGLIYSRGTYKISAASDMVNGNGFFNVARSYLLSDGIRPGAGELSTFRPGYIGDITYQYEQAGLAAGIYNPNAFGDSQFSYMAKLNSFQAESLFTLNIDPLVLDLNGNGLDLTNYQNSNILFNMDTDSYKEQTGWIGASDGFLVLDKNGDGVINDVSEIFSEYFSPNVRNGLQALATFDSNHDGIFNASDAAFSQVRVWQDANSNSQTDAGELKTLASLNITSISLVGTPGNGEIINGNEIQARTTMTMNGVSRQVGAVNLLVNPAGHDWSITTQGIKTSSEAGVTSYAVSDVNGATVNVATLGVSSAYGNSGNDTLIGDGNTNWLAGGGGSDMLQGGGGDDVLIIDASDLQVNIDGGSGTDVVQVAGTDGVNFNLSQANVEVATGGDGDDVLVGGGTSTVYIGGGKGNDIIIGSGANDALSGNDDNDMLDGGYGDDAIRGGRGDDLLIGGSGNDLLDGGVGNDVLNGGDGNDMVIGGGGTDTADGGNGSDALQLSGRFYEYTRTVLADGSIQMTDNVAGRDGTITIKNVEFFNFSGGNSDLTNISVNLQNPMPVDDMVTINATGAQTILASTLLGNDKDYQNNTLTITAVSDAIGGTAVMNAGNVIFTPTAGYNGLMSFKYTVKDSSNNAGLMVQQEGTSTAVEMKATVKLPTASLPSDPLLVNQWYLPDVNVFPVWKDYTGTGVKVGIFETDIFDYNHADLAANVATNHPNSIYVSSDIGTHATMVAGIIGAARDGQGAVGIAYNASLAAQKIASNADGMENFVHYDVVNNSYNFTPAFNTSIGQYPDNQNIVKNPATFGRDGLGTILVFGAGNERAKGADAAASDFNASRFGIEVGAINRAPDPASLQPALTPFSNPGASILVSAAGTDITSTSRLYQNADGTNFAGDYETAKGTSFATPIVSGIAALMLEANPNLGYRDVQKILAYTARSVNDPSTTWQINGAHDWNGGGMHVSNDYGYGNVDALAAVRLAETWGTTQTAANEASSIKQSGALNVSIPDGTSSITQSLSVTDSLKIEHVEVLLNLNHAQLGDLIVTLIAPDGTQNVLLNRLDKDIGSTDAADRGYGSINFPVLLNSTHFWGVNSIGTWQLKIEDKAGNQVGTLGSWELHLFGEQASTNDTYIYTNEFSTVSGSSRLTLADTAGVDTINAASVSSASVIDLVAGHVSTIAGRSLTIDSSTTIENAYTGDANDTLTGNASDNVLSGGRGSDVLSGGNGNDLLDGGYGNDTLTGGAGVDTFAVRKEAGANDTITDFTAGAGGDVIRLDAFASSVGFSSLTLTQSGANTIVTIENGQTLTLNNVTSSSLIAANFVHGAEIIGSAANDTITGSANVDYIKGFAGNDTINGGAGNDTIEGGLGTNTLNGDDGNDIIRGGDEADNIHGNNNDDQLYGNVGADTINGDDGNDTIFGGDGNDTLYGGNGNDKIYGGNGSIKDNKESITNDIIYGGAGNDEIHGTAGNDTLYGENDNDTVLAGDGNDTVDGGAGNDTLTGGMGDDIIQGGTGNDIIQGDYGTTDTTGGNDTLYGGDGDDIINGGMGNDAVYGDADSDSLNGWAGDDIVSGGTGTQNDMWGGTGSDRFVITPRYNANTDIIWDFDTRNQNERIDLSAFGLTSSDWGSKIFYAGNINYSAPDQNGVMQNYSASELFIRNTAGTVTLPADLNNPALQKIVLINVDINLLDDHHIIFTTHDGAYWGNSGADNLTGSADNDIIYGLEGNDTINGGFGKDQLNGGVGDDVLTGAEGADTIDGGAGIDTASYSAAVAAVTINLVTNVNAGEEAQGDILVNIENVIGSAFNDNLTGNDANNTLTGGAGNDTLNGGGADDVLIGGAGADTMDGGAGIDTVSYFSSGAISVNLATNSNSSGEAAGDSITNVENVIGSANNDSITGNSANNVLNGGAGNDTLNGGGADDVLIGGAGADTMDGGSGIDTVSYLASGAISINLATNSNSSGEAAGDSITNVENVVGSANNDSITGDGNANTLNGDAGNDTLNGGAGNDTLIGGAGADTMDGGADTDTLSYLGSVAAVTINIGNNTVSGGDATGDIIANFENVSGSSYNDTLTGNANANSLYGMDGNDTLNGGLGPDTLDGGNGIDTASYSTSSVAVTVNIGTNVHSGGDAQGDSLLNIENISGSSYNDTLTGSSIVNALYGMDGNDWLYGGLGADTLDGGNGTDGVGYGDSTVAITVNLATNVNTGGDAEGDTLTNIETIIGSGYNDFITGDANANTLYGAAGNDILMGGDGNDWLEGEDGTDTLIGGVGNDTLNGGNGNDMVSYVGSASAVNVNISSNVVSGGDAQGDTISNFENISGSSYNDTLTGNANVNTLYGMDGNDWLYGGLGADTLDGGNGTDGVGYGGSTVAVTVNLSTNVNTGGDAAGDTLTSIETIIGSAYNDSITGDANANTLYGGNGNDTIAGGDGNDWIEGNAGSDSLDGGNGTDTISYSDSTAAVTINLATNVNSGGYAQGDSVSNVENVYASNYNDVITGISGINALYGMDGNDTLVGGAGADILNGGNGTDGVGYSSSTSAVTVNLSTNVNTGGDAAGDTLTSIETIIGSAYNDSITGDANANTLYGAAGNDTLNGGDGNDWLQGEAGSDTLNGGNGNDMVSYVGSASAVNVNISSNVVSGGDAQGDTISNFENISGSSYNDTLTGNANVNTLYGMDGNDWLYGGLGADTLDGGNGTDGVGYGGSTVAVTVNLSTNVNTGGDAAGDTLTSIETIIGSAYNDSITGDANANTLYGAAGNDTLNGGDGNDWLQGEAGSDTIDGGNGTDIVSYSDSTAAVTINLGTNIHSGGSAAGDSITNVENVYGSSYGDQLNGNSSANTLYGMDGNDWLYGNAGADTLDGGNGTDGVGYSNSTSAVTVNLATNVNTGGDAQGDSLVSIETVIGSGYNDSITGDSNANTLYGAGGNDTLSGGNGNDWLQGEIGFDTMTGGAGNDTFQYSSNSDSGTGSGSRDIITDFATGDIIRLTDFAGTFTFRGTSAFTGTANEVNYSQSGGNTIIAIDSNGNGTADFQIELTGLRTMVQGDFAL